MKSAFSSFVKFSIGTGGSAIISLITIPIISWYFSPEEFGKSSMFIIAYNLFINLFSVANDQGFNRYYIETDQDKISTLLFSCIIPGMFFTVLGCSILYFFRLEVSVYLFDAKSEYVITLLVISIILGVLNKFALANLRMRSKSFQYSVVLIVTALSNAVFIITLAKLGYNNYISIIQAFVFSIVFTSIFSIAFDFKTWIDVWRSGSYDSKLAKVILIYSLPFVPTFLLDWGFQSIDRAVLRRYSDFQEVGIYSTATKISSALNVVQAGFALFWIPFSYAVFKEKKESTEIFDRTFNYVILGFSVGITLIMVCRDIIMGLLSEEYKEVAKVFPLLLFIPFFYCLSEITVVGINFFKKTIYHFYIIAIALSVNTAICFFLVPNYGAFGAAVGMFSGYAVFLGVRTYYGFKFFTISISFKKFILTVILLILPICLSIFVHPAWQFSSSVSMLLITIVYFKEVKTVVLKARKYDINN